MRASRRRLHAFALSLALHAALALLLVLLPEPGPRRVQPPAAPDTAVEVELVDEAPPLPRATLEQAREARAAKPAARPKSRVHRARPKASPALPPAAGAAEAAGVTAAGGADDGAESGGGGSSARSDLPIRALEDPAAFAPGSRIAAGYDFGSLEGLGAGTTLRRGDPAEDPAVRRRREAQVVGERVERLLADAQALGRVERGAVNSYFGGLQGALAAQTASPTPWGDTSKNALAQVFEGYQARLGLYGRTGSPYLPSDQAGVPQRVGAAGGKIDESLQTLRDFTDGLFSGIVAIVEIRQDGQGGLLDARLVVPSGERAFDDFVLRSVPQALASLPPPADRGGGVGPAGIHSLWAFEGRIKYSTSLRAETDRETATNALYLVLGGSFEETSGELFVNRLDKPRYVCSPRLLAVY